LQWDLIAANKNSARFEIPTVQQQAQVNIDCSAPWSTFIVFLFGVVLPFELLKVSD